MSFLALNIGFIIIVDKGYFTVDILSAPDIVYEYVVYRHAEAGQLAAMITKSMGILEWGLSGDLLSSISIYIYMLFILWQLFLSTNK